MKNTVAQFGLGKIGREIAKLVLNRQNYELVGLVDSDSEKVGRKATDILGAREAPDLKVTDDEEEVLQEQPDLAFHSTKSHIPEVIDQIKRILDSGTNIISTSEEMAYPYLRHEEPAEELNELAKLNGATLLGTGVNPGFAMDFLPLVLTGVARELTKIEVRRVQNASLRRKALQEKIGLGLTEEQFEERVVEEGGHVGLLESAALLGTGLGWRLEEIKTETRPVIAEEPVKTDYFEASPGEPLGIHQTASGIVAGEERIKLELEMYAGAENPVDEISLHGTPELTLTVAGGIHGDIATPAIAVNSSQKVIEGEPGLLTILDLYPYLYNFERGNGTE